MFDFQSNQIVVFLVMYAYYSSQGIVYSFLQPLKSFQTATKQMGFFQRSRVLTTTTGVVFNREKKEGRSTGTSGKNDDNCTLIRIWTIEDLDEYSRQQGVVLSLTTLGPGFRAVARSKHNTTQILGYVEGFRRPGSLLHLDKMEVYRKMVKLARQENSKEFKGGGTTLGVGLLLGYLCLLHGKECGCQYSEFLAIDDEDKQHKRLVRYYKHAGYDFVRYVGEDYTSILDRLVWGGCGSLLRQDIEFLLKYWTRILEESKSKFQSSQKEFESSTGNSSSIGE